MSMTFKFNLNPFGDSRHQIPFGIMRVHSAGDVHKYDAEVRTKDGWVVVACGSVPKKRPDGTRRSGHRNFLHLLRDILNDMDLDGVGENYVNVIAEVKKVYPQLGNLSEYPDE